MLCLNAAATGGKWNEISDPLIIPVAMRVRKAFRGQTRSINKLTWYFMQFKRGWELVEGILVGLQPLGRGKGVRFVIELNLVLDVMNKLFTYFGCKIGTLRKIQMQQAICQFIFGIFYFDFFQTSGCFSLRQGKSKEMACYFSGIMLSFISACWE